MKRVVCILLAAAICLAAAGCGASENGRPAQGNPGRSVDDVLNEKMNEEGQTAETASRQSQNDGTSVSRSVDAGPVEIDLTKLSSTMVYSEVYNMMTEPGNYMGKSVRMKGSFAFAEGDGRYYFACIIADATACCAQGIEFVLKDERAFPDEYPAEGAEITVVGVFDTYKEGAYQYCQLIDAVIE